MTIVPVLCHRGFATPTGKRMKGLLKVQRAVWYPDFKLEKATKKGSSRLNMVKSQNHQKTGKGRVYGKRSGLAHGTVIDNQLNKTVLLACEHSLPPDFFIDRAFRKTYECEKDIKLACSRLSEDTLTWWGLMKQLNFTPVKCQDPVHQQERDMGTAVDVLAKTSEGKYVILENKTGKTSYLTHWSKMMRKPYDMFTNSVENQRWMQIMHTQVMYEATHPEHVVDEAYWVQITNMGVGIYPLPAVWKAMKKIALSALKHAHDLCS
jgi:hypothetical protein